MNHTGVNQTGVEQTGVEQTGLPLAIPASRDLVNCFLAPFMYHLLYSKGSLARCMTLPIDDIIAK